MFNDDLNTTTVASRLVPVSPAERIEALDVLRGLAIIGVLIAYAVWNLGSPPFSTYGATERITNFILSLFINSKAYTTLAFLFGVGFSIQMARAREKGTSVAWIYCRRLLALMLIGLAHALLLRNGDILVPYAVMGFVLLIFRNASDKTVLAAAILSSLIPYLVRWVWELSGVPYPTRPETDGMSHIAANFQWVKYWYATAITIWPLSLPMFFAGLYVGRRILKSASPGKRVLRRLLLVGLIGGAGIFVLRLVIIGMTEPDDSPTAFVNFLLMYLWNAHAWGFASFYVSGLILLLQGRRWRQILSPVAAVGRMALTNYLLQSIIIVPICIAFDLYDRVTPTMGLTLAFIVASLQIPASVWWLKRFRFGPAEWLWRSLTYKSLQPMRIVPGRVPSRAVLGSAE